MTEAATTAAETTAAETTAADTTTAAVTDAMAKVAVSNPEEEEEKKEEERKFIYHGMGNVQGKTTVQNLESRKATWQTLEIPSQIEAGLAKLHYFKPSII